MAHRIVSVDPGSPAEKAGLRAGDALTHVNGEVIRDFLDFEHLTAEEHPSLTCIRNGVPFTVRLAKGEYEPTGLRFESPMMSGLRMCCNHCLFCFVDQLPPHVRPTMRVKDDDWRMSLLTGSYVTLTNVPDEGIRRIIARHASPLYISVHATDPDLRSRILGTPRAANLLRQLKMLSDGGIRFHCQCVLCPNLNDGDALRETIDTLLTFEGAESLALVPVGLTKWREGLEEIRPYTREEAREVIALANAYRERCLQTRGTRFVFPSDEFYLQAELPIPSDEEYEDYGQIDDGVGLLRLLETEFVSSYEELPDTEKGTPETDARHVAIACGQSASAFLESMLQSHPLRRVRTEVHAIENTFFGSSVTVSGLVTGGDLCEQMKDVECEKIFVTCCMLRSEGDRFLDDLSLEDVCETLQKPVVPVGRRGDELLDALLT